MWGIEIYMYFMYTCPTSKIVTTLFDTSLNVLEFSDVLATISVFSKVRTYH